MLDIDVITLGQLFAEYVGKRGIDLLSIDIEGLDADTITTMELNIIRPRLICVEANEYGIGAEFCPISRSADTIVWFS